MYNTAYQKPCVAVIEMDIDDSILRTSGEPTLNEEEKDDFD